MKRPSRNIPMSTVIVAATVVEMFAPIERTASLTKKLGSSRTATPVVVLRRAALVADHLPSSSAMTRLRILSTISRSWVAMTTVVPVRLMR